MNKVIQFLRIHFFPNCTLNADFSIYQVHPYFAFYIHQRKQQIPSSLHAVRLCCIITILSILTLFCIDPYECTNDNFIYATFYLMMNKFNNTFSISQITSLLCIRIRSYKTFSLQRNGVHSLRNAHNNDSAKVHTIQNQFPTYTRVMDNPLYKIMHIHVFYLNAIGHHS